MIILVASVLTIRRIISGGSTARNLLLQMLDDGTQFAHNGSLALVDDALKRRGNGRMITAPFIAAFILVTTGRMLRGCRHKLGRRLLLQQQVQLLPQPLVLLLQL